MATLVKLPNADGNIGQWTPLGGGASYIELDEATHDSDTTYIKTPAGGYPTRDESLDFDWSTINDTDVITQIEVKIVARIVNGVINTDDIQALMRDGIVNYLGTQTNITTSYVEYSHVYTTNLPTDGADLKANFGFGVRATSSNLGDDDIRVTRVEVTVTYIPASAASSERSAKILGEAIISDERASATFGGDGRYVEHFTSITKKDVANTTASWTIDGVAEMNII